MEDFIEIDHVYLTNASPYNMTVTDEGPNKGKVYKGWTYTFLWKGSDRKISSDAVDLSSLMNVDKDPVKGSIRLSFKDDKSAFFKAKLIAFNAE